MKTNSATDLKTVSEVGAIAIALGGIIVGLVLGGIGYLVSLLIMLNDNTIVVGAAIAASKSTVGE